MVCYFFSEKSQEDDKQRKEVDEGKSYVADLSRQSKLTFCYPFIIGFFFLIMCIILNFLKSFFSGKKKIYTHPVSPKEWD